MSQSLDEDDAVLKDLVSRALSNNGALGKLQAELRASVFLALEEDFKDRDVPLCNRRTQELLASPAGSLAASLVHDFLTCLGLDFSLSVYSPESNLCAGLWNLVNRQKLIQRLSLGQDDEPTVPVLLWQCRQQQLASRDRDGASQQSEGTKDSTGKGPPSMAADKAAPLKNSRLNTNKPNNTNDNNNTSQQADKIRNSNTNQCSSHSVYNNNESSSPSKCDLPKVTSASSSLPVVSKAVSSGAVASKQNELVAAAKGSKFGGRAGAASAVGDSPAPVDVSNTVLSDAKNSLEKIVSSKTVATDTAGKVTSNKSSVTTTNTTLTSSNSGGPVSSIKTFMSANLSTSPESLLNNKPSKNNAKGTTPTVSPARLTTPTSVQTIAKNSKHTPPGGDSSGSRGASSSPSRPREATVLHPPANILSAAPPDTRPDSADSSSSASEGDLQRLASSVLKGAAAGPGRPRQPLPSGGARPANRIPKAGEIQTVDEPDYDEDFSSSSTWSTESKSDGPPSSHGADREASGGKGANQPNDSRADRHAQDKSNTKPFLKSPEDSEPLETEEDISIGDFSTSESVSGREETEDVSAPPSRTAVVDYEESL